MGKGNKKSTKEEKEEEARRLEEEENKRVTDKIIKDVVEDLLEKTESVVYDKYLEEKAVDRATRTSLNSTILSLQAVHLEYEKNHTKVDVSWHIDEEPESPPIDTWARSAIRPYRTRLRDTRFRHLDRGQGILEIVTIIRLPHVGV